MLRGILIRLRPVMILVVVLAFVLGSVPIALAAGDTPNPYYSVETITLSDGTQLERMTISGPPTPPPGYELERAPVAPSELNQLTSSLTLAVPTYKWVFGCSAVSASMIGAYFDRTTHPNIYSGPTNGGVMPMDNSLWGTWTDVNGDSYPDNPLTASRNGSDSRTIKGSIDDYWVYYNSNIILFPDPYIGYWTEHAWGEAIGDYMKTSQSAYGNKDGATSFYNWTSSPTPLTCEDMEDLGIAQRDGTYGRKLFYEARGYTVADCYSQKTDNTITGGFSFAQYQAKIDAGYPVFLNLTGHSIVGIGYDDSTTPETAYLNDTWDYSTHTMPWGGSYSGMQLLSVSIADPSVPTAVDLLSFEATVGELLVTLGWETANEIDNLGFNLYRADSYDGERMQLNAELIPTNVPPGSPFGTMYGYTDTEVAEAATYYYWLEDLDIYGQTELHGPVEATTTDDSPSDEGSDNIPLNVEPESSSENSSDNAPLNVQPGSPQAAEFVPEPGTVLLLSGGLLGLGAYARLRLRKH